MTQTRKQIGWLIVKEGEKGTLHYETASWYKELLLDVGKHPLYATFDSDSEIRGAIDTSIHASLEGTVLSDAFPSSYGGHIFSSNLNKYVGQRDIWHYNPYSHALAHGLLDKTVGKIELLEGFEAREIPFVSYDGRNLVTYGIFENE